MEKPTIKDFKMIIHYSMATYGALKEGGTIIWPGNEIDGKTIFCETITPKHKSGDYGKAKKKWYLDEAKSPEFKTLKEFYINYA